MEPLPGESFAATVQTTTNHERGRKMPTEKFTGTHSWTDVHCPTPEQIAENVASESSLPPATLLAFLSQGGVTLTDNSPWTYASIAYDAEVRAEEADDELKAAVAGWAVQMRSHVDGCDCSEWARGDFDEFLSEAVRDMTGDLENWTLLASDSRKSAELDGTDAKACRDWVRSLGDNADTVQFTLTEKGVLSLSIDRAEFTVDLLHGVRKELVDDWPGCPDAHEVAHAIRDLTDDECSRLREVIDAEPTLPGVESSWLKGVVYDTFDDLEPIQGVTAAKSINLLAMSEDEWARVCYLISHLEMPAVAAVECSKELFSHAETWTRFVFINEHFRPEPLGDDYVELDQRMPRQWKEALAADADRWGVFESIITDSPGHDLALALALATHTLAA